VRGLPAGADRGLERIPFTTEWASPSTRANLTSGAYPITNLGTQGVQPDQTQPVAMNVGEPEAPFGGTPWTLPGQVQAENVSTTGGNYIGYFKLDPSTQG